jgi:hypothetical protein
MSIQMKCGAPYSNASAAMVVVARAPASPSAAGVTYAIPEFSAGAACNATICAMSDTAFGTRRT